MKKTLIALALASLALTSACSKAKEDTEKLIDDTKASYDKVTSKIEETKNDIDDATQKVEDAKNAVDAITE